MRRLSRLTLFLIIILSMLMIASTFSYAYVKVYKDVKDKIDAEGSADVIILFDKKDTASKTTGSDVRILSHDSAYKSIHESTHESQSKKDLSDINGFTRHKRIESLNGYSGILTHEGLKDLERQGLDVTIYENTIFHVLDDVTPSVLSSPLNTSTAAVNANYSWNIMNITGRNVTVAVIDTGIDYTHPDLGVCYGNGTNTSCKVFDGFDFVNNETDPMDDYGHGTLVSGILAANGSIVGVAPDAILYAAKACDAGGNCATDDILNAMDWAKNKSVDIISLSLGIWTGYGDGVEGSNGRNVLSQEVDILTDAGIVVVTAAGNSGPGVSTIFAPADANSAITVGAVDDNETVSISDDAVWHESSRGPSLLGRLDPELVAPGYEIMSTYLSESYLPSTGTSMAAPFVSGAAALLLEKYPSLNPSQVRAILLQSTSNIDGKLFEKGTGELDLRNALTGRVYAFINQTDTYNENTVNDRWEFVAIPSLTARANVTISNDNDYNVSFSTILEDIVGMENNDVELDTSQLGVPANISVANNSNYTFEINFTLTNFNSTYATTYGGIIFLNGSGYNGTINVTKTLRIPFVVTVPIMNNAYLHRTLYAMPNDSEYPILVGQPHDDNYQYCYYAAYPRNLSVIINWSDVFDDLDLYLYDSEGLVDTISGAGSTKNESVMTSNPDIFRWFRVDGYNLSSVPFTFDMNLTSSLNALPEIENITDSEGANNGTVYNPVLIFYRPEDITLNVSYRDADYDAVNVTINDSDFVLVNDSFNSTTGRGHASFQKLYNSTILRNSTILITLTDLYEGTASRAASILMYSSIRILDYTPSNLTSYLRQNDSIDFTLNISEVNGKPLYYYWSLNGTLNSTDSTLQNYTLDSSGLSQGNYTIDVLISNNETNNDTNETVPTVPWNIIIDAQSPVVAIQNPTESEYNQSYINISYDVADLSSGTDHCWMEINSTGPIYDGTNYSSDISLDSCGNTSTYLANGNYTLWIYSNDSVGNTGYSEVNFSVSDITAPVISNASPSGTIAYTTSVILSVTTDENATCRYSISDVNYSSMTSPFNGVVTSHTATQPVSAGTYLFYVRCADMSNNTNNVSGNISFTINSQPPSGGDDNGDNDGGGGGGDSIYYAPGGDESVTGIIYEYDVGETDVALNDEDIPVGHIKVNMNGSGSNASFKVTKVSNPEYNYSELVYAYLKVEAENFDFEQLQAAEIFFNIENDWLILNNISRENVVLVKYDDIKHNWTTLLTELLNESGNDTYYVAHTPGFGLFAVSHNSSDNKGKGIPPLTFNITKDIKENQSNIPRVLSESSGTGQHGTGSAISKLTNKIVDGAKRLSFEWIIIILFGVLVFVVSIGIALQKQSMVEYKEDIIFGTDKALALKKDIKNVLLEKMLPKGEDASKDAVKRIEQKPEQRIGQNTEQKKGSNIRQSIDIQSRKK